METCPLVRVLRAHRICFVGMHLYSGTTVEFIADATRNRIASKLEESFFSHFRYRPPKSEVRSWQNSLRAMSQALETGELTDHGVIVEYQLPLSSRRLDCLITGTDHAARRRRGDRGAEAVGDGRPLPDRGLCDDLPGGRHPRRAAPVAPGRQLPALPARRPHGLHRRAARAGPAPISTTSTEGTPVTSTTPVTGSCSTGGPSTPATMSTASSTTSKPTSAGAAVGRCSSGCWRAVPAAQAAARPHRRGDPQRTRFVLLDEQQVVFNHVLSKVRARGLSTEQSVFLIHGGPGTGKSVIAVNLLAELAAQGQVAQHATGSKAFTENLRKTVGHAQPPSSATSTASPAPSLRPSTC